jgi:transposase
MMGRQEVSDRLFYDFCLEDHVPANHLLRQLDQVLAFDRIRAALAPHYSHTGRPSVDPELMLRIMLIGYAYGIRSERRLCEEVHLNLAYRWFCRLGLEGSVPDHSTFSKNRYGRFQESGIYRTLFEDVVRQCQGAGLVGGEGFAVDGTVIMADANRDSRVPSAEELRAMATTESVTRPVRAWLEALDEALRSGENPAGRASPACISTTDPESARNNKHGHSSFGYFSNCPQKSKCTHSQFRSIHRNFDEETRDQVRALHGTDAYERSQRERKKVEMLFAHLKQHLGLRRLKLRGLTGATEECLLAATVQNLKRLIKLRPPDIGGTCLLSAA